jgi:hypothetical protein
MMTEAEHRHTPARETTTSEVPAEVARYLDGTDLLAKTQALRLSTIDAAGWPHASLLSAGDMVMMPSGRIRFALFATSGMAANLARDGRLTLTVSIDGGMCELRLKARTLTAPAEETSLAFFEAEPVMTRIHVAPYAAVVSGITFALHEPQAVLPRWQRQIAALRAAT